jgi:hypothetical protein
LRGDGASARIAASSAVLAHVICVYGISEPSVLLYSDSLLIHQRALYLLMLGTTEIYLVKIAIGLFE